MRTATVATAAALLTGMALTGCATDTSAPAPTATPEVATSATVAEPSMSASALEALPVPTQQVDWLAGAPAAGTDAYVAWEALMGPDGEYAAAASYQAVIDVYGPVEPYTSIKEAEERHIDALVRQLDRYGVTVPANPYLGVIPAPADLPAAAQAWAEGEVLNVEMYDQLLTQTSDQQLTKVLTNLRRASAESHLPTFELAAANGGTLTAEQMQNLSTN
jgi:hypothetical protein